MTLGTFLLSWLMGTGPARTSATTLRSTPSRSNWDEIVVQSVPTAALNRDGTVRGFHHFHLNSAGKLHASSAWQASRPGPHGPRTIYVAVNIDADSARLGPRQWANLTELLSRLQREFGISRDRIRCESYVGGSRGTQQRDHLNAMLRTR